MVKSLGRDIRSVAVRLPEYSGNAPGTFRCRIVPDESLRRWTRHCGSLLRRLGQREARLVWEVGSFGGGVRMARVKCLKERKRRVRRCRMRAGMGCVRGRSLGLGRTSPRLVGCVSMSCGSCGRREVDPRRPRRREDIYRRTNLRGRQLEGCHGRR